jgi:HAD superfamily hydrolase (TIGR01549 family)
MVSKVPEAVIFDWDGTLVNTIPTLFKSHNYVRQKLSFPAWSMEEYRSVIHRSTREVYPELYGSRAQLAIDILYEYYHDNHLQSLELFSGGRELVEYLYEASVRMAVVSNKRQDYLEREISYLGWSEYFEIIIGAGTAKRDKPNPDPLLMALDHMELAPDMETILYIGDTRTDLETSQKAKCASVLILNDEDKIELIKSHAPGFVYNNCLDLQKDIKNVIQQV